jgi:hypothetical protein
MLFHLPFEKILDDIAILKINELKLSIVSSAKYP